MSKITGSEPAHWHKEDGKHRMTDPRTIPGWPIQYMDNDERAYLAHLEAHESAASNPQRRQDDPAVISSLFDLIEANEGQNEKMRALIAAYRMKRQ